MKKIRESLEHLLRALRHPNYRLYFGGHAVSLVGTWMQQVAQGWLVYRLTGSATALGLVALAQQGPGFFVGPFAGALVDRYDKRRIIMLTQSCALVLAALLASLTFAEIVQAWHIFCIAFFLGLVSAIDIPARQTAFIEMVGREDLSNAIALNSAVVNAARVVGPAVAGVTIAAVGEQWCFALNALSYVPIIISFSLMRLPVIAHARTRADTLVGEVREGLRFVRSNRLVAGLLGLHGLCALVGMPYLVLMPAYAGRSLGGGARTLGLLVTSTGGGALLGALAVASRRNMAGLGAWTVRGGVVFGLGLVAFSTARSLVIAVPLLVIVGAGCMLQAASINTLLQLLSPDNLRGRIISLYSSLYMGMIPIGGLLAGLCADRFTEAPVLAAGGIGVACGSIIFMKMIPVHSFAPAELMQAQIAPNTLDQVLLEQTLLEESGLE